MVGIIASAITAGKNTASVYLFRRIERRSLVFVGLSVVYVALTLISALCSEYREIALWGQFDRAEGFFTTACYFVIFLFSMYSFKTTKNFRKYGKRCEISFLLFVH